MSQGNSTIDHADVVHHFTARAGHYDKSSHWCTADDLMAKVVECVDPQPNHTMLDLACGTGLVTRAFVGKVGKLVGLDLTPAMAAQAKEALDELVIGRAEHLPFETNSFDRITCRQGIQFMDAPAVAREIHRVLKPGGRVVLIDLAAYGEDDKDEYFEVLRLRNPARRNFWVKGEVQSLLEHAGFSAVHTVAHVSIEDVDAWSANGAISEARREGIRNIYRNGSKAFADLHAVATDDDTRFTDHMLFTITVGVR
jgi:ubiquinone/menaquinone biosynthesis C-methylase UbiE